MLSMMSVWYVVEHKNYTVVLLTCGCRIYSHIPQ